MQDNVSYRVAQKVRERQKKSECFSLLKLPSPPHPTDVDAKVRVKYNKLVEMIEYVSKCCK